MKWKIKKTTWVFLFQKYGKFWSILLEHFTEHKPLISEEWSFILFFSGLPFLSPTLTLQSMGRRQNSKHYFWTQSIDFGKGRKKEKWENFSQLHCWKLAHSYFLGHENALHWIYKFDQCHRSNLFHWCVSWWRIQVKNSYFSLQILFK